MDRILYSDNGSISDLSYQLENYYSETTAITLVAAEDKIYIGSRYPFNSKYIKLSSVNASASNMVVKYWDGNTFREVVNLIDETKVSGVTLSRSGYINFTPDRDYAWSREDSEDISPINSVVIYDMYWLEISFSSNIACTIQWLGNVFCTTNDIGAEYNDLNRTNMLLAWKAGKTDWEEQIAVASEIIIDDLISEQIITHGNQLLERRAVRNICVSKTAELIYSGLGDDYIDQKTAARNEYKSRLKKDIFKTDKNANGILEPFEERVRQGRLHR